MNNIGSNANTRSRNKFGTEAKLPNFLIVGAPRCGTTSLYYYLSQHPKVFMPRIKEPCVFIYSALRKSSYKDAQDPYWDAFREREDYVSTLVEYVKLFEGVEQEEAIGEASPQYLSHYRVAIPEIKKQLGDVKIIIILRNPIERAFSHYKLLFRREARVLPFQRYLEIEEDRRKKDLPRAYEFIEYGFYYQPVKAFMENFDKVRLYLYEDMVNDTLSLLKDIYGFLGVDSFFVPEDMRTVYNATDGIPRNWVLHEFLRRPSALKSVLKAIIGLILSDEKKRKIKTSLIASNLAKSEMKPETRNYLKKVYWEDMLNLQALIKRDLSNWLVSTCCGK